MYRIGIVGSGPAAFYTALKLLKSNKIKVDMFEKLPVPFGLVRYGVAPDHPEVKNVINTFNQVAQHNHFRFFGNVTIGQDLSIREMKNLYNVIVLAYGAAIDKKMNIPGEDLKQVYAAIDIVGWYNGLPEKENFLPDLSGEEAIIIGHGNVALDIARILLSPIDLLKQTDIPDQVLAQLLHSKIKRIHLVGRRGPLQVAFTIKEFREITKIRGISSRILMPDDLDLNPSVIDELPRARKRLTNLIMEISKDPQMTASSPASRELLMHFLRSPREILSSDSKKVKGMRFGINKLQGDIVTDTGSSLEMPCQLVIRSIGYRSTNIDPDIPFDDSLNLIPHIKGRVIDPGNSGRSLGNLYCVGWIKRGPVGVIITTLSDAQETSDTIVEDLQRMSVPDMSCPDVDSVLSSKGVKAVTYADWEAIDRLETSLGQPKGKPREKLTSLDNLMTVVMKEKEKKIK